MPKAARGGITLLLVALLGAGCAPTVPSAPPAATPDPLPGAASGSPSSVPSVVPASPPPSSTPSAPPAALPTTRRTPEVPRAALNERLDQLRERLQVPGVSVAIRWDDGRVWLGASGMANTAAATPVTPDTGFGYASVSKTYTGAVILQLVEEGLIGLDHSAARWLPAAKLDPRITIRMLLDHTSGLTDFFFNPTIDRRLLAAPDATWTAGQALALLPPGGSLPGKQFRYSNTNYLLLGLVVEAATGQSLADDVRTRLLDPLGLNATWVQVDEAPLRPLATAYRLVAKGGTLVPVMVSPSSDVSPFRAVVTAAGGAGQMAGTANDAARWMQALVTGDVLQRETRRAVLADAEATRLLGFPYGLGIQVVTLDGQTAIGHSGRYLGVRSVVRYLPGERLAIAVLTNQSAVDPARIAASLLQLVSLPRSQCAGCPEVR